MIITVIVVNNTFNNISVISCNYEYKIKNNYTLYIKQNETLIDCLQLRDKYLSIECHSKTEMKTSQNNYKSDILLRTTLVI